MIYYRARKEYHDYFTGNTTVPGELITREQRDSMFRYLSDNCFECVRVERTHTCDAFCDYPDYSCNEVYDYEVID